MWDQIKTCWTLRPVSTCQSLAPFMVSGFFLTLYNVSSAQNRRLSPVIFYSSRTLYSAPTLVVGPEPKTCWTLRPVSTCQSLAPFMVSGFFLTLYNVSSAQNRRLSPVIFYSSRTLYSAPTLVVGPEPKTCWTLRPVSTCQSLASFLMSGFTLCALRVLRGRRNYVFSRVSTASICALKAASSARSWSMRFTACITVV